MFRKLALAAVLAVGAAAGLAFTPAAASAQPPVVDFHGHARFRVLVRHYGHWDVVRTYRERCDADEAARRLERRGFDARVEVVRGR